MDKSRVEPTIFFIEKISFALKLFSGHFYGQILHLDCPGSFKVDAKLFLTDDKAIFDLHWTQ